MRYRFLGRTSLAVSELCLGAMTFGREADEETSLRMMDRFAEAGGTFLDTADAYGAGRSEQIVGHWLKQHDRADWVISTKVRWGPGGNRAGLGRKHVMAAAEGSLRRLGTDHIDLYHVHGWDPAAAVEDVVRTLDLLVTSGKVRYLAVSNWAAWQIQKALGVADKRGWEPFAAVQPRYNLLDREFEWEQGPLAADAGLGVLPWSPLRGGWLTGRYTRGGSAPADSRIGMAEAENWGERWGVYDTDRTWRVLDELRAVATAAGREPAQVALNWLLQRPTVTAPIIGARNLEQLESDLGAAGWDLDPALVRRLDDVTAVDPLPFPYDTLANSGHDAAPE
ncbi:oxidoreductase [Paractinoplanes abujensis]|uniref:Aryl-alcohol dehydrogenase-like predicted oxidoreductase n=1 Tax=Paractinoplanes abujensis TaxID=882441 RepID=A0A7W7G7A3_9ACTN|nr:aldo/keto reductase [Actinoplanes abujensis]MBB4698290.1 aryl-alcohol dehydrogenase-like predicted oxidoreductase [Actinoplanes abujensis]GID19225.1 oxidoreductase [Actinoplanes abujensis]